MTEQDISKSANNTRPAKLPALNVPRELDNQLRILLEAVKERLEVREGQRGNPFERALTVRDLEQFQTIKPPLIADNPTAITAASITESRVRELVSGALTPEVDTLRSSIATLERKLSPVSTPAVAAATLDARQQLAYSTGSRYTKAMLSSDLASGGARIFSGATSGAAVMELDAAGQYVLFKNRLANINGLGAGYTGVVRTAVGVTAAGVVAGYNRKSDGAWQNSIVIESATGDVTILGTLKAGSVIETGATVAGTAIGTVATNASTALSTANAASAAVASKLDAGSSYVLAGSVDVQSSGGIRTGSVTWNNTTGVVTGGTGVVMTQNGITAAKAGVTTFSLTAAGDALFAGSIDTGGQARFFGNNQQVGLDVKIGGVIYQTEYSSASFGNTFINASKARVGAIGRSNAGSAVDIGVLGIASFGGVGVAGDGNRFGGYFSSGGIALEAFNTSVFRDVALSCQGKFKFGPYIYEEPNGSTAQFMRRDGTWAAPIGAATSGAAAGTFVSTNKPGTNSSNTWLPIVVSGVTYYVPAWT